jgi:hypothetical protein
MSLGTPGRHGACGLARRFWQAHCRRNREMGQGGEVCGHQSGLIRVVPPPRSITFRSAFRLRTGVNDRYAGATFHRRNLRRAARLCYLVTGRSRTRGWRAMGDRYQVPTDDGERSKHKAYAIAWEHEPRKILASFDTLTEAIEAIRSRTVPALRLDRRYVVHHAGRIVWPERAK